MSEQELTEQMLDELERYGKDLARETVMRQPESARYHMARYLYRVLGPESDVNTFERERGAIMAGA